MSVVKKDKDDLFKVLDPKIPFTIEHTRSKQTRTLYADSRWHNVIRADWGEHAGYVEFDVKTGRGKGNSADWIVTLESLRVLNGDPDFTPKPVTNRRAFASPRPVKVDPRQVDWTHGQGGGR